jgi:hypothetical protein
MKHFLLIVGLMGCHTTSQPTRPASAYRTIEEIKKDVGKAERIIDKAIKQGAAIEPKQAAKQSLKWFAIVIGGTILITLAATQACTARHRNQ